MKRILFLLLILSGINTLAQTELSSDELFVKARDVAFNQKDRKTARQICITILRKSPDYADVSVFLGRLYTWDGIYDSARVIFNKVILKDPSNSDAISAAIDMEYWSGNSRAALKFCNLGISKFPSSPYFLYKGAQMLNDLEQYDEAFITLDKLFQLDNSYSDARTLSDRLKEKVRKNSLGLTYEYSKFDKTFDPWQISSVSYSRRTPIGTTILRMNLARRFDQNGKQFEIDLYPGFASGFYAYLNFGYSKDGIFPKQRYGASIYLSLPWSLEIEGGFRYLKFSSDVWIYTASVGKYISNYWFSLRTFITPQVSNASHSYSLIVRYYPSDSDHYFGLSLGTGISPNESSRDLQGNWLSSNKFGLEYQGKLGSMILFNLSGDYSREEISTSEFRGKLSAGIGIKFVF